MTQKCRPAGFVFLGTLAEARISRKPSELTAEATSSETLRTSPATALHPDPVEIEIRMLASIRRFPPGLDLGVDLLVQVRHRARADAGAPQRLRDVLPTRRTEIPARYILDQRFLDRALRRR